MKLLVAVLILTGCATAPGPPGALPAGGLPRFYRVSDGVFRSPQPTAGQFRELTRAYGVRSVLKLNSALEGRDELPDGVELMHHPMLGAGPIDHDDVQAALDELEAAPKPLLIHCEAGVDRTGLIVALYRVRHGAWAFAAFNEWIAFGSHRFPLIEAAFFRETGWRP